MATNSGTTSQSVTPSNASVQEFKIRVPKNVKKKHHVMRFNATLNVDFAKWSQVKMERENNMKEFKGLEEDQPKFGAGSEYGRDAREEARRKKFGIVARKYKPEDQPWILKVGGKTGKKFKGIREGGVSENAAYYVFTHAADGAIEAYPLQEWYNFQPIQRYKSLSAEEAEQEFGRRNKVMNFFSLMLRKRLRGDEIDGEADDPEDKKVKGPKAKELKISDMDEWMDSSEDSSSSEVEKEKDADSDSNTKKKSKKAEAAKKKKKKRDVDDEAFEESDDGDEEGRERDYISDSSESESDHEAKVNKELKGVAEEDALRKLLTSDEDSEEEKSDKVESEPEDAEKDKEAEERSKKLKKKKKEDGKKDSSSDFSSDSDSESETAKKKKKLPKEGGTRAVTREEGSVSAGSSRSATPTPAVPGSLPPSAKRAKIETVNESGITEEAVRRYLMRKPMTTTELLTKFKSKKSGVSSDRLVETMTQILKRINPVKQMIKGKMYGEKTVISISNANASCALAVGPQIRQRLHSSSDFSSDSDSESETAKKKKKLPKEGGTRAVTREEGSVSAGSSRSATPTPAVPGSLPPSAKRAKIETVNESGITEEAVRRYLMRKPMTTTELLTKFKSKKSGVSSDRLVETMTQILKRINPVKQMIKGKMYLSIKA